MHLVAIAWLYVAFMMALAEALSSQGSLLGALFTFALYGVLPLSLVLYIGLWPARRRLRSQREGRASAADQGNGGGHAAGAAVAAEREER